MDGLKRKRRCELECKQHIFQLRNVRNNSNKYDLKHLFCPKFQRDPLPPQHTYAQYNDDGKYYTSAFVLGVDRRHLTLNDQQQIMDHQKQIRDSLQKQNQLVFPRPNSKHIQCSVCKQPYKNYYFHIASQDHRQKIVASPYNQHIQRLCNIYRHLWEGAEERAEEMEMRLEEEERIRNQAEEVEEEDIQELLIDVERGSVDQQAESVKFKKDDKNARKGSRMVYVNQDTIPIFNKPLKRANSDMKRPVSSQQFRKRNSAGIFVATNPTHSHRERQQRRYQRQRDKIKMQAGEAKQYLKNKQKQGDVFVIMKSTVAPKKPVGEFVWKKSRMSYMFPQQNYQQQQQQMRIRYQNQRQDKLMRKQIVISEQDSPQKQPLHYGYGGYQQHYRGSPQRPKMGQNFKHSPQRHKSMPPFYYPPYYPSMEYPPAYPRQDKQQYPQRQKNKSEKGYQYNMMPYHWAYPPPFYMQHMPPPQHQANHHKNNTNPKQTPQGSYVGTNTSININFPTMCIYPSPPPYPIQPGRYPLGHGHQPYMGYPYAPPYRQQQPRGHKNANKQQQYQGRMGNQTPK